MPWYEYSLTSEDVYRPLITVRIWHGNRHVNVVALVDSGADTSVMNISYADVLGLDRAEAKVHTLVMADGSTTARYSWPERPIELEFDHEWLPFKGDFVEVVNEADHDNLLGREDFFDLYIVQFWQTEKLMNIDKSPDYPRQPHAAIAAEPRNPSGESAT